MSRSEIPITITLLESGEEAEWAEFLETADRATLFHDLRFLVAEAEISLVQDEGAAERVENVEDRGDG